MPRKWNEPTLYIDTPYRPDPGSFCRPKDVINGRYRAGTWFDCREVWHYEMRYCPLFFYSHKNGKSGSIMEFIKKIEDKLGVPKSHIGPTQRKTICWIEPSQWWINRAMRRSFYTILLRVGQEYKPEKDNFEEALFSHIYTQSTRFAVERFLDGYTKYTGKVTGWYNQFCLKMPTTLEIESLLVK